MITNKLDFIKYLQNNNPLNYLDFEVIFNDVSFEILHDLNSYLKDKSIDFFIIDSIKIIIDMLNTREYIKYKEKIKSTSKEMYEFIPFNEVDLDNKIESLFL